MMNLKVEEAARLMNKSPQFIRIGLQRNLLPFGTAIKKNGKYNYYISREKFEEYTGIEIEGEKENERVTKK